MPKIMIVDDEPDTVELISFILGKDGYTISKAYSGEECLKIFGKGEWKNFIRQSSSSQGGGDFTPQHF